MKKTFKHISVLTAVVLILSVLAAPALAYETNVSSVDVMDIDHPWATPFMSQLVDMGVVTGYAKEVVEDGDTYTDYYLKPDQLITRAEFSTMLAKALNLDATTEEVKFSDVDKHWAKSFIYALADKGIIKGYEYGTFLPDEQITRAEIATMLTNSLNKKDIVADKAYFSDITSLQDHWAFDFIQKAAAIKIINGYDDDTFRADNFASRAEVMTMLVNFLNNDLTTGPTDDELSAVTTGYQKSVETVVYSAYGTGNDYDFTPAYDFVTGAEALSLDSFSDIINSAGTDILYQIKDIDKGQVLSKSDRTARVSQTMQIYLKSGDDETTVTQTVYSNLMKEDGKWLIYSSSEE